MKSEKQRSVNSMVRVYIMDQSHYTRSLSAKTLSYCEGARGKLRPTRLRLKSRHINWQLQQLLYHTSLIRPLQHILSCTPILLRCIRQWYTVNHSNILLLPHCLRSRTHSTMSSKLRTCWYWYTGLHLRLSVVLILTLIMMQMTNQTTNHKISQSTISIARL